MKKKYIYIIVRYINKFSIKFVIFSTGFNRAEPGAETLAEVYFNWFNAGKGLLLIWMKSM